MKNIYFEVMTGTSSCLAITDGDGSGIRIAGDKQWGGGKTMYKWCLSPLSAADIIRKIHNTWPELIPEYILQEQTELLREVALSGVELDDERLDYLTVQIDRTTWDAVKKLSEEDQ